MTTSAIGHGLPIIRVPVKFQAQLDKAKKVKKIVSTQKLRDDSQKGKKLIPIITCKRKEYNYFKGQNYGKFDHVSLASNGWAHKKASGDYFTIHRFESNPAFGKPDQQCPSFEDLGLDHRIGERFREMGLQHPTNIQRLAIPELLRGSNTLVAAETGNGKTYSFIAPIIHNLLKTRDKYQEESIFNSPKVLVIAPGRELVMQTRNMARDLANPFDLNINSVIGGRTKLKMTNPSMTQPDVLIATLGVLSKLVTNRIYTTHRVQHIVLDEADTLMDDSFNEHMVHFLSKFPIRGIANDDANTTSEDMTGVQLSLIGATFPKSLQTILKDVVELDSLKHLKTPSLHRLAGHVQHTFYRLNDNLRAEYLLKLARDNYLKKKPTIIFSNTTVGSDFVSLYLNDNDIPCIHLNAELRSVLRRDKFERFKSGEFPFLSCTDVASRGLNTTWVQDVINFDCPHFISDYVHRSGRTGRVGSEPNSKVVTFVTAHPMQLKLVQEIEYATRKKAELPNVNANIKRKLVGLADQHNEVRMLEQEKDRLDLDEKQSQRSVKGVRYEKKIQSKGSIAITSPS